MPTVASIIEPKLAELQARIEAVRTQLRAPGVPVSLAVGTELNGIAKDMQQVSRYAELLISEVLRTAVPAQQAPEETAADILRKLTSQS